MFNKNRQEIQENQTEMELKELSDEQSETLTGGYLSLYSSLGTLNTSKLSTGYSRLRLSGSFLSRFQSGIEAAQ